MMREGEIDEVVKQIASDSSVRVAFVVSLSGEVETCYPQESEKQVKPWAIVITAYLKLFAELRDFRFSRLQYREGDLWMGRLYGSQFLVLLLKPSVDLEKFYKNMIFTIQNLHEFKLSEEETNLEGSVQRLLYQASDHLTQYSRSEEGFFGALRKTAFLYFGALGEEWVDQSLESLWITLPIRQLKPMEEIIEQTAKRMSHPLKRSAFKNDSKNLIKKFLE